MSWKSLFESARPAAEASAEQEERRRALCTAIERADTRFTIRA